MKTITHSKIVAILLLLPFFTLSCLKEEKASDIRKNNPTEKDSNLPPITSDGRQTAGFVYKGFEYNLVDTFYPGGTSGPQSEFSARFNPLNGDRVLVKFNNVGYDTEDYISFSFLKEYSDSVPIRINYKYPMHGYYENRRNLYKNNDSTFISLNASCDYVRFDNDPYYPVIEGYLEFSRFDTVENIVAGTFEITAYIDQERTAPNLNTCQDTARITKGRFDMIMTRLQ